MHIVSIMFTVLEIEQIFYSFKNRKLITCNKYFYEKIIFSKEKLVRRIELLSIFVNLFSVRLQRGQPESHICIQPVAACHCH